MAEKPPFREDRKRIGEDIKTIEFGWPVGMPVCRSVGGGIYEVRSDLAQNRIARVLFILTKVAEWCSCMGSSRRLGRRPTKIEIWHNGTRRNMRGRNEGKKKEWRS